MRRRRLKMWRRVMRRWSDKPHSALSRRGRCRECDKICAAYANAARFERKAP